MGWPALTMTSNRDLYPAHALAVCRYEALKGAVVVEIAFLYRQPFITGRDLRIEQRKERGGFIVEFRDA